MKREEFEQHDFHGLGISPGLLKRIGELGFVHPTPIQYKAIPIATSGEDVVGVAQTGSGKTLAFAIPMLQHVAKTKQIGLVLLPTRELAVQVEETIKKIGGAAGLRTAILIGGIHARPQIKQLRSKPHIIVATPGRLIDLVEQRHVSLKDVGILVLDEADRMLDMGFEPQLKKILAGVPEKRQTMLFSATMPEEITMIAKKYMAKPLRIEVAPPGTTADKIDQEVFIVPKAEKGALLEKLLKEYKGSVLIFSRTKHGAKNIARRLRQVGHSADEIHSNRSQNQRQTALKGFSTGRFRVLVATDIAARGIDVDNIELVINYDIPEQLEDYVHRIGRTGRAGRSGKAITFAAPDQKRDIGQIQNLINVILPIKSPAGEELDSIQKSSGGTGGRRAQGRNARSSSGGYRGGNGGGSSRPSRARAPRSGGGERSSGGSSGSSSSRSRPSSSSSASGGSTQRRRKFSPKRTKRS